MRARRRVKASERGQAVKVHDDGREVCLPTAQGRAEYARRRDYMAYRQMHRCAICHEPFGTHLQATFDHEAGRSAWKRNERLWHDDGRPMNAALCVVCQGVKGSTRYEWREGVYVPALNP